MRVAAIQNLVALWNDQEPEAVERWLNGLPAGSLRDSGMSALSEEKTGGHRILEAPEPVMSPAIGL